MRRLSLVGASVHLFYLQFEWGDSYGLRCGTVFFALLRLFHFLIQLYPIPLALSSITDGSDSPIVTKQAFAGVLSVLLEAAKNDWNEDQLR